MNIFFDGTACGAEWRNYITERLKVPYTLYTSDDRSIDALRNRDKEKEKCDFVLYVISPKMQYFDMVFESVDDSNKRSKKTLFCFMPKEGELSFSPHQSKSLIATGKMIQRNGGKWYENIDDAISFLNAQKGAE